MGDMDDIVREFLIESYENLDQLDQDLVALEGSPDSRALLGSIFRTIHTIKGTAGFLAFGLLERIAHAGENLLVELRDGQRLMDMPTTNVLLRMVDTIREILRTIEASGAEGEIAVDEVIDQIREVLENRETKVKSTGTARAAESRASVMVPSPYAEPVNPVAAPAPAATPRADAPKAPRASAPPTPRSPAAGGRVKAGRAKAVDAGPGPDVPATGEAPGRAVVDASIRVDVDLLDALMRQVGELVLARNQISRLAQGTVDIDLVRASQRLSLIASELQEGVMKTRMQPIDNVWAKMPRIVRDLAAVCGRQVRLDMVGGDTELDRTLLEAVKDPLTHLVRNAVDHGIEAPDARLAAGKSPIGVLSLRSFHAGGQVVIEVKDDGKGIDTDRVAAKAVDRGLRTADEVAAMGTADLLQLLFLPGFSMAEAVTNVSGRGVGMDVVRTKIEAIGGTVEVDSVLKRGTTWRLRIPLTLAIMPALTVGSGTDFYAIPQVSLLELVALNGQKSGSGIEYVNSAPVYRLRGDLLPLLSLREVLGSSEDRESDAPRVIAVLQAETQRFGLVVDRVLNTEEIVVKALPARLKAIGVYAGATLLGDGRVSLILDVQAIARRSLSIESADGETASTEKISTKAAAAEQVLVVGIGEGRRVAIPLGAVTRLELVRCDVVEHVGGREVVQYRGAIVPLVRLDRVLGSMAAEDGEELLVVVYTRGVRSVAIVVQEILDIVDDDAARHSQIDDGGLVGSTVLKDRVTERLDVANVVLTADPTFFDDVVEKVAISSADEEPATADVIPSPHNTLVGATR